MFFPPTLVTVNIFICTFFSLRFKSKQTKIWGQVQYDKNDAIKKRAWPFICYLLGCPFTLVEDANEQITWWYLVLQPVVCS